MGAKVDGKAAMQKLDNFAAWFSKNIAPTAAGSPEKAVIIVPVLGQNFKYVSYDLPSSKKNSNIRKG